MRPSGKTVAAWAACAALCACGSNPPFSYTPMPGPPHPGVPDVATPAEVGRPLPAGTWAEFRNVDFRFDEDLVLRMRLLRGVMKGTGDRPVAFDQPDLFTMEISEAETSMGARDLTALLGRYVFGYPDAPIRDLTVSPEADGLHQKGILHKVIDIPFEMPASVSVDPNGWIRIHPEKMTTCGLPGLGFMEALGIALEDLIDLAGAPPGIKIEQNDFLLDPLAVLPPPRTRGRLIAVRIEPGALVQTFTATLGSEAAAMPTTPQMPIPDAPNYMYFWGGVLHFGKLFMPEVDMQVVDVSPADPFDFFLDQYNYQLVAGFTHNELDYGLTVHMVDYDELAPDARGEAQVSGAAR